jgi:hypothetical protein
MKLEKKFVNLMMKLPAIKASGFQPYNHTKRFKKALQEAQNLVVFESNERTEDAIIKIEAGIAELKSLVPKGKWFSPRNKRS